MTKKIIFSAAAAILASAAVAFANPYQGIRYAETEGKVYQHLSGQLAIADSTATWSTYTIVMDGNGLVTASSGSFRGSVTAASLTATTINGTSFIGLPITSTAAISASLSSLAVADIALQAADVIHTSSITALQVSTGALQTQIDAVILSTGSIVAGTVTLTSTQTFSGGATFTSNVVFDIPSTSSMTRTCPANFTSVQSQGVQWGCIQTAEEGSAAASAATLVCFDKYGGRLPSFLEMHVAFARYSLTDETDDTEWNAYADWSTTAYWQNTLNTGALSANTLDTSLAYRCWIPR